MIKGLADRLKELRQKLNLSQKDVATYLDLSPSIISGYETGERTPSALIIIRLADLYHCSTDYILGKSVIDTSAYISLDGLTPEQIQSVTSLVNSIRKEQKP